MYIVPARGGPRPPARILIGALGLNKHYAANLNNVRGNYTFPTAAGTAYTQELPRDFERYYGIRIAFSGS